MIRENSPSPLGFLGEDAKDSPVHVLFVRCLSLAVVCKYTRTSREGKLSLLLLLAAIFKLLCTC